MITVKVHSEEELMALSGELLHALVNVRYWTKKWEQEYGCEMKIKKKYWEARADELIAKMQGLPQNISGNKKVVIQVYPDNGIDIPHPETENNQLI